jgi:hypothetical protein
MISTPLSRSCLRARDRGGLWWKSDRLLNIFFHCNRALAVWCEEERFLLSFLSLVMFLFGLCLAVSCQLYLIFDTTPHVSTKSLTKDGRSFLIGNESQTLEIYMTPLLAPHQYLQDTSIHRSMLSSPFVIPLVDHQCCKPNFRFHSSKYLGTVHPGCLPTIYYFYTLVSLD